MKVNKETEILGLFGTVGLLVFSLTVYFGFGLHGLGIVFGVVTLAYAGFIASVIKMQRSKSQTSRLR